MGYEVVNAVEHLEKAKDELYSLKIESENNEKWGLAESLEDYIESIQLVIDTLTDDEEFVSKPDEGESK